MSIQSFLLLIFCLSVSRLLHKDVEPVITLYHCKASGQAFVAFILKSFVVDHKLNSVYFWHSRFGSKTLVLVQVVRYVCVWHLGLTSVNGHRWTDFQFTAGNCHNIDVRYPHKPLIL